ncbi:MAG: type II toxin-antitoxin system VapC family toxin [Oceanococcaceae bacterium]
MGLIYLDTCLVIYLFEDVANHGARLREQIAVRPETQWAISPLVSMECLVGPLRSGDIVLQRHYEEGLRQLRVLPLSEPVFLQAAALRARFGLRTPDALHLAAAQHHRCEALWTNDDRLAEAARGLAVNPLRG